MPVGAAKRKVGVRIDTTVAEKHKKHWLLFRIDWELSFPLGHLKENFQEDGM